LELSVESVESSWLGVVIETEGVGGPSSESLYLFIEEATGVSVLGSPFAEAMTGVSSLSDVDTIQPGVKRFQDWSPMELLIAKAKQWSVRRLRIEVEQSVEKSNRASSVTRCGYHNGNPFVLSVGLAALKQDGDIVIVLTEVDITPSQLCMSERSLVEVLFGVGELSYPEESCKGQREGCVKIGPGDTTLGSCLCREKLYEDVPCDWKTRPTRGRWKHVPGSLDESSHMVALEDINRKAMVDMDGANSGEVALYGVSLDSCEAKLAVGSGSDIDAERAD